MNPLDYAGPQFLVFYLLLWMLLGLSFWLLRNAARGAGSPPTQAEVASLQPYEMAYLMGGDTRTIESSVAALSAANHLSMTLAGPTTNPRAFDGW